MSLTAWLAAGWLQSHKTSPAEVQDIWQAQSAGRGFRGHLPRLAVWHRLQRGAQTLTLAAKVRALLSGRYNVSFDDVRRVLLPAMRHRVILNFEADAEGIDTDKVLLEVLQKVPEKGEDTKVA